MKNFITIGTFDGVHKGHLFLFKRLEALARENKMKPLVLYFPLPPKILLDRNSAAGVLTLPEEKKAIFKALSLPAKELSFKDCRNISAENFFTKLPADYNAGGILAGKDFAFGKDRGGHLDALRRLCAANNVVFESEEFFKDKDAKISSSRIRADLQRGQVEEAAALLGRPYEISGPVVKGAQFGRKMGFPTANVQTDPLKILPMGVYAGYSYLGKDKFKTVINIGVRPSVKHTGAVTVEAHLLDFDRDIYGKNLRVEFISKIRGEKKFASIEALKEQITDDANTARKNLK